MKTKRMLLATGALSAILWAPAATAVDFRPLVVAGPRGSLHVVQSVPCDRFLDFTSSVSGGRIEMTPAEGFDVGGGDKTFSLTRLSLFFTPFVVEGECQGIRDRHDVTEAGIRLVSAIVLRATPNNGQYLFRIPKEQFLFYDAVTDNGIAKIAYEKPGEDVTGTIDLARGTLQLHIVVATRLRFRAGCSPGGRCLIDELRDGTRTADIAGTIAFPDTDGDGVPDRSDNCVLTPNPGQSQVRTPVIVAPPNVRLHSCVEPRFGLARATDICSNRPVTVTNDATEPFAIGRNRVTWSGDDGEDPVVTAVQRVTVAPISCTAINRSKRFQVSAATDCGPLTMHLGSYEISNGEVIRIQVTARPGVRLVGTGRNQIRHFQVGRGEAIVTATDTASEIVATDACR